MTLKNQTVPPRNSSNVPPYPLSPQEIQQQKQRADFADSDNSLHPLSNPSALDMNGVGESLPDTQKMLQKKDGLTTGLPDALKVGAGRRSTDSTRTDEVERKSAAGLREGYEIEDLPETLRLGGGGRKSNELRRPVSAGSSSTIQRISPPFHIPPPLATATVPEAPAVASPLSLQSNHSSPVPQMKANLTGFDYTLNEFSPFYNPPAPSVDPPRAPDHSHSAPLIETSTGGSSSHHLTKVAIDARNGARQRSISSVDSSVFYEPGEDLSTFDASYSRAIPGYRGELVVGMEGWQTSVLEDASSKTWEEDVERRAKAGAELQKRAEEAKQKQYEEHLQQEYWEHEKREKEQQANQLAVTSTGYATQVVLPVGTGVPSPAPLSADNLWCKNNEDCPRTNNSQVPPLVQPQTVPREQSRRMPAVDPATELYTIKHVNILSPITGALHRCPILLQNTNGPCPLMALVNAITISTPTSEKSALSEVLRLREQVSLSLLIQAVFEELMTRKVPDGQTLPDVGDLFAFLITLHTGMNVNPRFNTPPGALGAFENTKELQLYAALSVPLVHGWLPDPGSDVAAAFERSAKTYDETQTLLFVEEELITRATSTSSDVVLTPSEHQLVQDAATVNEFISRTATQLTTHGLETLRHQLPEMKPAILFRNDHFSTILRRPGGQLVALVTDMGFASHEEVVWEVIADVNGRDNAFLSGDFRPVGGCGGTINSNALNAPGPPPQSQLPALPQRPPLQTIRQHPIQSMLYPEAPTRGSSTNAPTTSTPAVAATGIGATPPAADEDYDFALAIQLQEEEDARERNRRAQSIPATSSPQGLAQPPMLPPRGRTPPPPYEHVSGNPFRENRRLTNIGSESRANVQQNVGRRVIATPQPPPPPRPLPAVGGGKKESGEKQPCVIM